LKDLDSEPLHDQGTCTQCDEDQSLLVALRRAENKRDSKRSTPVPTPDDE